MKHSEYIHKIPVKDRDGRIVAEKEVVSYAGLLDLAHQERLSEITTKLLQTPDESNGGTAIAHATVRTAKGTFTGIGDANARNVNPRIAPHIIRMAETRAIARSLRGALNIGAVALEELGDENDLVVRDRDEAPPTNHAAPAPVAPAIPIARAQGGSARATDAQRKFLYRLLQQRGIEGEAARSFLQRELGAASVADAPKHAVSALIDRLQNDAQGGAA